MLWIYQEEGRNGFFLLWNLCLYIVFGITFSLLLFNLFTTLVHDWDFPCRSPVLSCTIIVSPLCVRGEGQELSCLLFALCASHETVLQVGRRGVFCLCMGVGTLEVSLIRQAIFTLFMEKSLLKNPNTSLKIKTVLGYDLEIIKVIIE